MDKKEYEEVVEALGSAEEVKKRKEAMEGLIKTLGPTEDIIRQRAELEAILKALGNAEEIRKHREDLNKLTSELEKLAWFFNMVAKVAKLVILFGGVIAAINLMLGFGKG